MDPDIPTVPCPEVQRFSEYVAGTLPPDCEREFQDHLSRCPACRRRLTFFSRVLEGLPEATRLPARIAGRRRIAAAAAALAAIGAASWIASPAGRPPVAGFPGRTPHGVSDPTGPADRPLARVLDLPQGGRLSLMPGTSVRILDPEPGERFHARVEEGDLEADVAPGSGVVRFSTPAATVEVLGTRFRLKAYDLRQGPETFTPCAYLDLREGKVRLSNASGSVLLQAPSRGLAVSGRPPGRQEVHGGWEEALGTFEQLIRGDGAGFGWPAEERTRDAAFLLAATFWGLAPEGICGRLSRDPEPSRRAAAALLGGSRRPGSEQAELGEAIRSESDPAVRDVLRRAFGREGEPE